MNCHELPLAKSTRYVSPNSPTTAPRNIPSSGHTSHHPRRVGRERFSTVPPSSASRSSIADVERSRVHPFRGQIELPIRRTFSSWKRFALLNRGHFKSPTITGSQWHGKVSQERQFILSDLW